MEKPGGIPVWRRQGLSPIPECKTEKLKTLIIGGGPVGLTIALDLARNGNDVVLLNQLDRVTAGSKAICFAKRTLDIWNRLGVGEAMLAKGVIWNTGKVFWGSSANPIYEFDLLPVKGQQMPAFINLQQYHAECILIDALAAMSNVELRWGHCVDGLEAHKAGARVHVVAGEKSYNIETDWLIACDGCHSTIRQSMGLDFEGRVFEDNFLIADIKMKAHRPSERWFWFDSPFNPGQCALLHKQPDNVWRLDFQLGENIDREASLRPENVELLVRAMLGADVEFEPEWYSVYSFQCRRMTQFVHGRVVFAGDAAHLVSPFGARGCNGGIADADNLVWKLDLVLNGKAPTKLLESYEHEAIVTADENILNSTRATDFMAPKSVANRALRDAVLELASDYEFARPFVNSGRLSTAISYPDSPLNTPDEDDKWRGVAVGHPAIDAPLRDSWLLQALGGRFVLLCHQCILPDVPEVDRIEVGDAPDIIARFDFEPGSAYLIRPDQYVAARWRKPEIGKIIDAVQRAKASL